MEGAEVEIDEVSSNIEYVSLYGACFYNMLGTGG